jgi:hypothetical protein
VEVMARRDVRAAASFPREIPRPRPRFSRSTLWNVLPDDEAPLIG